MHSHSSHTLIPPLDRHKNSKNRSLCRNIKLLMLHVRDCPGTTSCSDICPFPWCRKTKHLLYHLVSCIDPVHCNICSRNDHSFNLEALKGLNDFRMKKRVSRHPCISFVDPANKFNGTEAVNPHVTAATQPSLYHPSTFKSSSTQKKIASVLPNQNSNQFVN